MKAKMVIFSIAFFALTGHNFFHNNVTFDVFFLDPAKKKIKSLAPNKFDVLGSQLDLKYAVARIGYWATAYLRSSWHQTYWVPKNSPSSWRGQWKRRQMWHLRLHWAPVQWWILYRLLLLSLRFHWANFKVWIIFYFLFFLVWITQTTSPS